MARDWGPNNPIMKALTKVFDLMLLNVLFIITSIPVITIGASLCALHSCLLKMVRNEEGYIIRSYFRAFRENFLQATVGYIIFALVGFVIYLDSRYYLRLPENIHGIITTALFIVSIVFAADAIYYFPFTARFENTIFAQMKHSLVVAIVYPIRTIICFCICFGFGFLYYNLPLRATPVLLLFGASLPALLIAYIYTPILKKMEGKPKKEDETEVVEDQDDMEAKEEDIDIDVE